MINGGKSSNLVKSHELKCHFIRLYLVPLPPQSLLSRYILCFHYQITSVLLGSVRPPKKSEMRFFLEDNGHELPNARWVSTGYLFSEHMFFSMKLYEILLVELFFKYISCSPYPKPNFKTAYPNHNFFDQLKQVCITSLVCLFAIDLS